MKKRLQGHDLLTRSELAKAIGKSKTTVRRWEETGKLKATVDERGVHLFRVEDALRLNGGQPIESLPRARAYVATAHGGDGELAAKIFDFLLEGVAPVKIVARLRVHPDVLEGFIESWARLRHGFFLNGRQVRAISYTFQITVKSFDELVKKLERVAALQKACLDCKRAPPLYCNACLEAALAKTVAPYEGADARTQQTRTVEIEDDARTSSRRSGREKPL